MSNFPIGRVTHYYDHLKVAVIELNQGLHIGDYVYFCGHTTNFHQKVTSLEVNHHQINEAEPEQEVAIKVMDRVRPHDCVYRSTEKETRLSLEEELLDAWQR